MNGQGWNTSKQNLKELQSRSGQRNSESRLAGSKSVNQEEKEQQRRWT